MLHTYVCNIAPAPNKGYTIKINFKDGHDCVGNKNGNVIVDTKASIYLVLSA